MIQINDYISEKLYIGKGYKSNVDIKDSKTFIEYLEDHGAKVIMDENDDAYVVCDKKSKNVVESSKNLHNLNVTYPYFLFADILDEYSRIFRKKIDASNISGFTLAGATNKVAYPTYTIHNVDQDGVENNSIVMIKSVGLDYEEIDNKLVFEYSKKNADILLKYLLK